jgi:hypothetical protein
MLSAVNVISDKYRSNITLYIWKEGINMPVWIWLVLIAVIVVAVLSLKSLGNNSNGSSDAGQGCTGNCGSCKEHCSSPTPGSYKK